MNSVRFIEVTSDNAGQRLDNFLLRELKSVPKTRVYRLIRKGEVRVNKGRSKPEYKLQLGDQVRIPPVRMHSASSPEQANSQQLEQLQAQILFENENLLVFNKRAGLAVHSGSGIAHGLIDRARQLRPECSKLELVHRLDRGTSGCLVLTKNRAALLHCQQALQNNTWIKHYQALVWGQWKTPPGDIEKPLLKREGESGGQRRVEVSDDGRPAHTKILAHQDYAECTWLQLQLLSGRTHQIRVHCASSGYPLLGDELYSTPVSHALDKQQHVKRLMLHASFLHLPGSEYHPDLSLSAPLPEHFHQWMNR